MLSVCEYNIKYYLFDFILVLNEVKKCQTLQNNQIQNSNKKWKLLKIYRKSQFQIFHVNPINFPRTESQFVQITQNYRHRNLRWQKLDVTQKVSKKLGNDETSLKCTLVHNYFFNSAQFSSRNLNEMKIVLYCMSL